jgi:hypothetical protein
MELRYAMTSMCSRLPLAFCATMAESRHVSFSAVVMFKKRCSFASAGTAHGRRVERAAIRGLGARTKGEGREEHGRRSTYRGRHASHRLLQAPMRRPTRNRRQAAGGRRQAAAAGGRRHARGTQETRNLTIGRWELPREAALCKQVAPNESTALQGSTPLATVNTHTHAPGKTKSCSLPTPFQIPAPSPHPPPCLLPCSFIHPWVQPTGPAQRWSGGHAPSSRTASRLPEPLAA